MKSQLKCLLCKTGVDSSKELENHLRGHDQSEIERFSCHLCILNFVKFSSLVKHLQLVHLKARTSSYANFSSEIKAIKEEAYKELAVNKVVTEDEEERINSEVISEKCLSPKRPYICEYENCKKTFIHQTSYVMHGRCVHSDLRNFTCEICSKAFKTSSNLNVHIKMHKNQRDHQCPRCPLSFFTSSHLKAHLKIHSKDTRYDCDVEDCGKSFIHLSSFKKHQNAHRGLKAHQCNVCQRSFSQSCHLREHVKTHTNERNHHCQTCQKAFRRADTLRIHLKTHDS